MVVLRAVIDTSILIELFDRGREELLEEIYAKYKAVYVPWIALYEYLYGCLCLRRSIEERKGAVEKLAIVVYPDQQILLKALSIDVDLHKRGVPIPLSDILVAATAITLDAELLTRDERHYRRIPKVKLQVLS